MTKSDLIESLASVHDLPKSTVSKIVDGFLDGIVEGVANGQKVTIAGFGNFEPSYRAARSGRNPATGAPIEIAATTAPKFSAGKVFKDKVAGR